MENQGSGTQAPDISQMLTKIMSNPQATAMLSSLLGGAKPPDKEERKEKPKESEECFDKEQTILPPKNEECSPRERRKRLLLALKPYLSPERCQAIDRILMITEALSLLQTEKRP